MSNIYLILSFVSVVAGLMFGILHKDLRILGTGIMLGVLFWTLGFTTDKQPKNNNDDGSEQGKGDT